MNTFKQAAKLLLLELKKPLSYKELTDFALERKLIETGGKSPDQTMNAVVARDIKRFGPLSDFKKVGPGVFDLNEKKEKEVFEVKEDNILEELENEEKAEVDGGYIGKAGEHLVTSELLFRGFNASIMSVDVGMDIVATKDGKLYNIQVKTRNVSAAHHGRYYFNIRVIAFKRHSANDTYYIFVLRNNKQINFLIMPHFELEKHIKQGAVLNIKNFSLYRATVILRDGKAFLGNLDNNVTYYLNNWELIK